MIEFAEAVLSEDTARLMAARQAIHDTLGADAVVDSAGVAALFNAIDRIADSTGAPLEADKAEMTAGLRAEIGIDAFAAQKEALDLGAGTMPLHSPNRNGIVPVPWRYLAAVHLRKGGLMSEKLGIGDSFPDLTINLVGGGTLDLPGGLDTKYKVILFYRGHW
jgi:hypothetical protein